jgi:hypothetical protein
MNPDLRRLRSLVIALEKNQRTLNVFRTTHVKDMPDDVPWDANILSKYYKLQSEKNSIENNIVIESVQLCKNENRRNHRTTKRN